jgi:AAA domain/TrwC relaxase/UvrD-like helicase C-terminal domain
MYGIALSELAKGAKDLGYEISMGKHGNPELAHITREQIEHFSQRSREVVAALESEGLSRENSTAAQKRAAALATREVKREYDQQALRAEWIGRGRRIGLREYVPSERRQLEPNAESETSSRSVQFAMEHLSEREAVFTQRAALIEALRASRGDANTRSVAAELDRRVQSGELLQDGAGQRLTTPRALEAERQLLTVEVQGRDKVIPILSGADLERPVMSGLNTGQRSVVELILMTPNRIVGVNGLAGTGKTTALTTARNLANQHGFEFVGLAPSHSSVRALNSAGVESQTVQRWLLDRGSAAKLGPKSVVVLDEASLAGTATLRAVLERVERAGARAVLVGDVNQYQSVEAGRGFVQLQQNGMQTAQLTEMVRQRNARLAEAARVSVHAPARSLELLPIVEDARAEFRHQHIAESFASASPEARTQTLVLTGTHEARRDINARIRAELKLTGSGEHIDVFRRIENTAAERKAPHTYQPGLTIRFEKSYRSLGVQRGDTVKVERVFADSIVVSLPDGTRRAMAPRRLSGKGWSVGTVDSLEVAAGDRVRFTGTDPTAGFKNGERGIVEDIRHGRVAVRREDHQVIYVARDRPASLDYSYAVTGHSAQGLDADRVILEKDTHSLTTNHRSFYTDVTRAREAAVVVTDSAQRLAQVAATGTLKSAAMDIAAAAPSSALSLERGE